MKAVNNIEFLSLYHKELKKISKDIKTNLHILDSSLVVKDRGVLQFVKFSDLKDSWLPSDYMGAKSKNLEILGRKLCNMIERGRAIDIKPMVKSIINDKIKKLTHKNSCGINEGEFLGYGHFRWDFKAITLKENEIQKLKQYFNL